MILFRGRDVVPAPHIGIDTVCAQDVPISDNKSNTRRPDFIPGQYRYRDCGQLRRVYYPGRELHRAGDGLCSLLRLPAKDPSGKHALGCPVRGTAPRELGIVRSVRRQKACAARIVFWGF